MTHRWTATLAVALASIPAGCVSHQPPPPVPTGRLTADIGLRAEGDGQTEIVVALVARGSDNNYAIDGRDELTVIVDGTILTLVPSRLEDEPVYAVTYWEAPVETDFLVGFSRDTGRTASNSRVQLPTELTASWPDATTLSRAGDDLRVTWSPSGTDDEMRLEVVGDCLEPWGESGSDTGEWLVPGGFILDNAGDPGRPCDAEVSLIRLRPGVLDPEWDGGAIYGSQVRRWTVESVP